MGSDVPAGSVTTLAACAHAMCVQNPMTVVWWYRNFYFALTCLTHPPGYFMWLQRGSVFVSLHIVAELQLPATSTRTLRSNIKVEGRVVKLAGN
jgi:hypothetical protein